MVALPRAPAGRSVAPIWPPHPPSATPLRGAASVHAGPQCGAAPPMCSRPNWSALRSRWRAPCAPPNLGAARKGAALGGGPPICARRAPLRPRLRRGLRCAASLDRLPAPSLHPTAAHPPERAGNGFAPGGAPPAVAARWAARAGRSAAAAASLTPARAALRRGGVGGPPAGRGPARARARRSGAWGACAPGVTWRRSTGGGVSGRGAGGSGRDPLPPEPPSPLPPTD